jgi:hypothetical protein
VYHFAGISHRPPLKRPRAARGEPLAGDRIGHAAAGSDEYATGNQPGIRTQMGPTLLLKWNRGLRPFLIPHASVTVNLRDSSYTLSFCTRTTYIPRGPGRLNIPVARHRLEHQENEAAHQYLITRSVPNTVAVAIGTGAGRQIGRLHGERVLLGAGRGWRRTGYSPRGGLEELQ